MSAEDDKFNDSMESENEDGVNESLNGKSLAIAKLEIPFNSNREAEVACNSLRVDPEPKRSGSSKKFDVKNNILYVEVRSPDVRQLRTAVGSFMDLVHLVAKTIDQFGPPHQQLKKICA